MLLAAVFAVVMAASCSPTSFSAKFRLFVESVNARYTHDALTREDWERDSAAYQDLLEEYNKKKLTMSRSEKQEVREYMELFESIAADVDVNSLPGREPEAEVDPQAYEKMLKGDL